MRKCLIGLLFFVILSAATSLSFRDEQKRNPRVRKAYEEKEKKFLDLLIVKKLTLNGLQFYLRVFKKEKTLEVWARDAKNKSFQLITTYAFCKASGMLGPKRKKGDGQTPEGFYYIDRFNPASNFYLSLGINYPNKADKIKAGDNDPGGDIFIHGDCVTIGCIPVTDDKIKELYMMCVEVKNANKMKIPVHIFPCKMDANSWGKLAKQYAGNVLLLSFWNQLKAGYDYFEKNKNVPLIQTDAQGNYSLQ